MWEEIRVKYEVKIKEIGKYVYELAKDGHCIIIYNENINDQDLKDIAVTHSLSPLTSNVEVGDTMELGENKYPVTAVGNVAMNTLRELGHCTIKFDGANKVSLPGEVHVEGDIPNLSVGDRICFY